MSIQALIAASLVATAGPARPPSFAAAMVQKARQAVGTPYQFGGRLRRGEGIDCLGLVLFAAEGAARCSWRSYPYNPTELVRDQALGRPVEGLSPVASSRLQPSHLRPGDVLMLVASVENPAEPAIGTLDGQRVWVWHMGLYSGNGRWLVGDHFAGRAVETELLPYLKEHADTYSGVFVTRMEDGPKPKRCRARR